MFPIYKNHILIRDSTLASGLVIESFKIIMSRWYLNKISLIKDVDMHLFSVKHMELKCFIAGK